MNMALKRRKKCKDLIFHSDRGIQYACKAAVNTLESYNITQSMSRKGNCWDNAVAESFLRIAIFEYIELWYNKKRRHSALNNLTIDEFWNNFYKTKTNLLNVA